MADLRQSGVMILPQKNGHTNKQHFAYLKYTVHWYAIPELTPVLRLCRAWLSP
jgi:hypothetical protein